MFHSFTVSPPFSFFFFRAPGTSILDIHQKEWYHIGIERKSYFFLQWEASSFPTQWCGLRWYRKVQIGWMINWKLRKNSTNSQIVNFPIHGFLFDPPFGKIQLIVVCLRSCCSILSFLTRDVWKWIFYCLNISELVKSQIFLAWIRYWKNSADSDWRNGWSIPDHSLLKSL